MVNHLKRRNTNNSVDVLLPWLSALLRVHYLDLNSMSDLIECLLSLLTDDSGAFSEAVKSQIHEVYESLNQTLKH
jgi:hypothetical protein